jgi:ring-1,2-phenylacetyl-CoA epoxidase subunit PaaC
MSSQQQALYQYCLRIGDNALVMSYRLSEWCSKAPLLEEDLALTNIALDMIGRAQAFLKYAAEIEGSGKTEDDLAYRRPERQFYNHLITELPNNDFAYTVARSLYIAAFEHYYFQQLSGSTDAMIASLAAKTHKEVLYHLAHFRDWTLRLGDGTPESHNKMQKAINDLWMYTGELFETDDADAQMLGAGIGVDMQLVQQQWTAYVALVLQEATLALPPQMHMQTGSRRGIHTEYLGHILAEMQFLQRAYPDAQW